MKQHNTGHSAARPQKPFKVGEAEIHPLALEIRLDGRVHKVQPLVMQVLLLLAEAEGQVVARTTLFERLWPDEIPNDETLTKAISKLRKALRDQARKPTYIETIPKVGYRLLAPVVRPPARHQLTLAPRAPQPSKSLPQHHAMRRQIRWLWGAVSLLLALLAGQWYLAANEQEQPNAELVPWARPRVLADSTQLPFSPEDMKALADSLAQHAPPMRRRRQKM